MECPVICPKSTDWLASSVVPDQMPHYVASDLGLHCLFCRPRWLSQVGIQLVSWRLRVWPPPNPATFFHGDWNIFCGHFVPSADSQWAVVSFSWKNLYKHWLITKPIQEKCTYVNWLCSPWPIWVYWAVKPQHKQTNIVCLGLSKFLG